MAYPYVSQIYQHPYQAQGEGSGVHPRELHDEVGLREGSPARASAPGVLWTHATRPIGLRQADARPVEVQAQLKRSLRGAKEDLHRWRRLRRPRVA